MNDLEQHFKHTDGVASFLCPTFLENGQIQFNAFCAPYQLGDFNYSILKTYLQHLVVGLDIPKFFLELNESQFTKKQSFLQRIICNKVTYIELTETNSEFFNEYMQCCEFPLYWRFEIDENMPNNQFIFQSLSSKLDNKFNQLVKVEKGRFALNPNFTNEAKWVTMI